MKPQEFNLLDEPWIRLLQQDGSVMEVSLPQAFEQAHRVKDLAGELPTQDFAMLRLLLAVLLTVFSRVDIQGHDAPITMADQAFDRWSQLWEQKQFPIQPIRDYLEHYRHRFWLFDQEFPFYQVPSASIGTQYDASKLNGELLESSNKVRLFPMRSGKAKNVLSYSEAARWLLFLNGFDDSSIKPKQEDKNNKKKYLPSGVGYLGKLGLVSAKGSNLFETLMLNLTFCKDGTKLWPERNYPIWEQPLRTIQRNKIVIPRNPAELLTLASRRIILIRNNDQVTGYRALGGDFFDVENIFEEQMTMWTLKKARSKVDAFVPKHHDPEKQFWREFSSLVVEDEERHLPGIVKWIEQLQDEEILEDDYFICFKIASVQYDKKQYSSVDDQFEDSLTFHQALLKQIDFVWKQTVINEIDITNKIASLFGILAINLTKAAGGSNASSAKEKAKTQFYARIDQPFRQWLRSIDPNDDTMPERKQQEWDKILYRIAYQYGDELVEKAGPASFVGRTVENDKKEKVFYSSSSAMLQFTYQLRKTLHIESKRQEG